ncbi:MAG: hypothetical protein IT305_13745 [Chloroflexi bacterium]|nr:hypothetical protein [Chloroflexota bacterium]
MRRSHLVLSLGLSFAAVALGLLTVLSSLLAADWVETRNPRESLPQQIAYAFDRGDRLHYVVHLAAGRAADLCACAPEFAQDQYRRAAYHARTDRQLALVTSERPTVLTAWVADTAGVLESGARWTGLAAGWVAERLID